MTKSGRIANGILICTAVLRNFGAAKNPIAAKQQEEAEANARLLAASDLAYDLAQWIADNFYNRKITYQTFCRKAHERATAYLAKVNGGAS